jgi:acyl-CoA hydrolase
VTTEGQPHPPERVLDLIAEDADLIVPIANGEPVTVLDAIEQAADGLTTVRIHQMHTLRDRAYLHGKHPALRHVSYFLSHVTRPAFHAGTLELVPSHFSEVPALIRRSARNPVVIAAASGPDADGYFSLGTSCDYVAALAGEVPFFLESNAQMPFTGRGNRIHISDVVGWCEADYPLVAVDPVPGDDAAQRIAGLVAERVPDGATIQAGIGAIPNTILSSLHGHSDLGVHTELVSDGFVDLIESGAVTGARKTLMPGRAVTTFALGSQRLYRWLDGNDVVDFQPVSWVNDPRLIGRLDGMVSINATTEVDLYGQCASETIAGRWYSSSGGQVDFARGAMYARDGQGFMVLPSTAKGGTISRIVFSLAPGSAVTTQKNTVDHVVTEYGVAALRGRSLRERAHALIAIAHPDFREELTAQAREAHLI